MSLCPVCSSETATDDFCLRCSPTEVAASPIFPSSGKVFANRYRADSELGRGGFGVVYRATDLRLQRPVALKILNDARAQADDSLLARFERESLILASLDHPHIIPIYDAGVHDETAYIVMKLVDGSPLSEAAGKRKIPEMEALRYIAVIGDAVAHAHSKGVLHRDIKPSNVLVSSQGRLYLVDFGISTAGFLPNITEQGAFVGTLHYMAPEATMGEATERSDIYSLGVLLHELVFGRPLFEASSAAELIHKICYTDPAIISTAPPSGSDEIVSLIRLMVARDPAARIESAAELVSHIERISRKSSDTIEIPLEVVESDSRSSIEGAVEQLSESAQKIIERSSVVSVDEVLEESSRFLMKASAALPSLRARFHSGVDSSVSATVLSFLYLVRELHAAVLQSSDRSAVLLRVFGLHFKQVLLGPLEEICSESAQTKLDDPFAIEPEELSDSTRIAAAEWKPFLLSDDEMERHRALMALLGPSQAELLVAVSRAPDEERARLTRAIWSDVYILMVEGKARSAPVIDAVRSLADDEQAVSRWRLLASLFRRHGESYWDPFVVETSVSRMPEEDRRVFGRCLMIHPADEYRQLALKLCAPDDLWYVIANPMTPPGWHLMIWRYLAGRVSTDFLKVYFVCLRDGLVSRLDKSNVVASVDLLKEFYEINAFHEDIFFRMLSELDESVRSACESLGFRVDLDKEYTRRMKTFFSGGVRKERDVEEWAKVPLPIQRRIARSGHFLQHFSCHPLDTIAMECLPHILKSGNARPYAEQPAINARLIGELAKERRLFDNEEARFALVKNPKTAAFIVMKHISFLRRDNLKKLAESREGNQFSRRTAQKMLGRR